MKDVLVLQKRQGYPVWTPTASPTNRDTGKLVRQDNVPSSITLEQRLEISNDYGNNKDAFLAFERRILKWLPEDRPSTKELLNDPWFARYRTCSQWSAMTGLDNVYWRMFVALVSREGRTIVR